MFKVMIAEDSLMLADILAEIIVAAGYEVCGIASTVDDAIELGLSQRPDLAVLDLRLADGRSGTEIADRLTAFGRLGVLYTTGNVSRFMLTAADGHACLSKPYSAGALVRSLAIVMDIVAARTVLPPFPAGFRMLPLRPLLDLGPSFRL
jgi:two-component system, response regulator PdtaR